MYLLISLIFYIMIKDQKGSGLLWLIVVVAVFFVGLYIGKNGLEDEVNRYLAKTPCGGMKFSEVGRFEISPMTLKTLYVIPKNLEEEEEATIIYYTVFLKLIGEILIHT